MHIIDYCFFASTSKISESVVNENILWYGIYFHINEKDYLIARGCLNEGKVSYDYYFSSGGEPLGMPFKNTQNLFKINYQVQPFFGN